MKKRFRQVYMEITNACNLSCPFCVQDHQNVRFLSLEQVERILRQIQPYTSYVYLHVLGEPLFHPQLEEILKLCHQYDLFVNITTNGSLLKRKKDIFQNYPVRQINVSLHSLPWQSSSLDTLKDILQTCDQLSENTYISYRLWCQRGGELDPKAKPILDILKKWYHCDSIEKDTLAYHRYLSLEEVFCWPSLKDPILSDTGRCRGLKDMLAILSNGDVTPCCLDAYGQAKLGNLFEQDLKSILDSSLALSIYQGFLDQKVVHPLCQRCSYRLRFDKKKG